MKYLHRKRTVALSRLSAWFDAMDIVTSPSRKPGFHLTVLGPAGEEYEVAILEPGDPKPYWGLYIHADDVNSVDIEGVAFFAFRILASQTGHPDVPNPIVRGGAGLEINKKTGKFKKAHYQKNFELSAMRHRDLRRAPNPKPQRFQRYMPTIERICKKFWLGKCGDQISNEILCKRNMLDMDDLRTYAMIW